MWPRLGQERAELEETRYARFAGALRAVNERLSRIFCALSGMRGDAYCSHPDDGTLAFAQGVTFHVRRAGLPH